MAKFKIKTKSTKTVVEASHYERRLQERGEKYYAEVWIDFYDQEDLLIHSFAHPEWVIQIDGF
jgi:hypothetical protein